ncbi:Leucine-rich repeat protein kinase family protein isoform 1 [Hibiscus syriacus]|uniref:Leucine-rich repeat protein kinase family protein isoform 1 n=1 Tax=Hibiscus syriacus TaxID=106335 RepID=A0A6A2Z7I7_HIBSY|nr:Leucine-rich repeat protein kinase family protein isoform 1 [Hibiscus syriacus]
MLVLFALAAFDDRNHDELIFIIFGIVATGLVGRLRCSDDWFRMSFRCLRSGCRAAAVPRAKSDGRSEVSTHGRKATIREFYGVILPSLQRLHGCLGELDDDKERGFTIDSYGQKRIGNVDREREDECGICLEPCTEMALPFFVMQCASNAYQLNQIKEYNIRIPGRRQLVGSANS